VTPPSVKKSRLYWLSIIITIITIITTTITITITIIIITITTTITTITTTEVLARAEVWRAPTLWRVSPKDGSS
jgi:hypothetical protein